MTARQPRVSPNAPPTDARRPRRDWLILAAILLAGLGLRAAYLRELVHTPDFTVPRGDMAFHDYWARAIATGDWTPPAGAEDPRIREVPLLRPPGYPWFLAAVYRVFGLSHTAPRVVQMALGLVNVALGFLLARWLFGRTAALIFAAMLAGYGGLIYFEGELSAPVLLTALLLAVLLALRRWMREGGFLTPIAAGALLGAAALTTPNALALAPVVLVWGWFAVRDRRSPAGRRRYALAAGLFTLATAAAITPAALRNLVDSGEPVLIASNGGITIYAGNHATSDGVTATLGPLNEELGLPGWSWFHYSGIVERIGQLEGRAMSYREVSGWFTARALAFMRENPGLTLSRIVRKAVLFWGPAEISAEKVIDLDLRHSTVLRYGPGFSPMLALGLVGGGLLVLRRRLDGVSNLEPAPGEATRGQRRAFCVLIAAIVLVYAMSYLPFLVSSRFRAPIVPLVMLFSAYAIATMWRWASSRAWGRVAGAVAAFGVVYVAVGGAFGGEPPSASAWHLHRGQAFHLQGRFDEALHEYEEARRLAPDDHGVLSSLALTHTARGDFAAAVVPARRATELRPNVAGGYLLLGKALVRTGQRDEGLTALRRAAALAPDSVEARTEAAFAEAQAGRFEQAAEHFAAVAALQPREAQPRVWLGNALVEVGRLEDALASYREAVTLDPAAADAHHGLGVALQRLGRGDEAAEAFREALRRNPAHPQAKRQLESLTPTGNR